MPILASGSQQAALDVHAAESLHNFHFVEDYGVGFK